jgi:hypothetical protein
MKRIVYSAIGVALSFSLLGISAKAQSQPAQSDSLGDYAKQIRKDNGAPKPKKVFDNDNLPTTDKLSVVGNATSAPAGDNSEGKTSDTSAAPASGEAQPADANAAKTSAPATAKTLEEEQKDKDAAAKQWGDKISTQKDQIDLAARELDVLQREYQLRAAAMYADAGNRLRNQSNWDKEDADYKQKIADKQKTLDDAKAKLDELQESARKAGMPASVQDAPGSGTANAPAGNNGQQ